MKVLHVIDGLEVGGAELMLKRLVRAQRARGVTHSVVSLTTPGAIGPELVREGVGVTALGMRSAVQVASALSRLVRLIRARQPDLVQTWLYQSDLLGGFAARLAGECPVLWGVHTTASPRLNRWKTRVVARLCASLSNWAPAAIVCCADSAAASHAALGYARDKLVVIHNGVDLLAFPSGEAAHVARARVRAQLGLSDRHVVVGAVGRFGPDKDYETFIRAASALAARVPDARFLLVGHGLDDGNPILRRWIDVSGRLRGRMVLVGHRDDVPRCLAAMDVFCLSSVREGCPTVVCEAMATGLPCVVTDAGDAGTIVGDAGVVVPRRDPLALALALEATLRRGDGGRVPRSAAARARIRERFSIDVAAERYLALYESVVATPRSAAPDSSCR